MSESEPVASDFATQKLARFPTDSSEYNVFKAIGQGAFAKVYHAEVKHSHEEVAIKILDLETFETSIDDVNKEIVWMKTLQHPNVQAIHCSFVHETLLWIVMPFSPGGSCADIIKKHFPEGLRDEVLVATIVKYCLEGLVYLHNDNLIHRDIKAGNILIGEKGDVQLCDFGVAGQLLTPEVKSKNQKHTFTGTPCWMAPEVMMVESGQGYNASADIWSLGISTLELVFGRAPYSHHPAMKVLIMTMQNDPPTAEVYPEHKSINFGKNFHHFVHRCLKKKPEKRPSAAELLAHKWIVKKARDKEYIYDALIKGLPTGSPQELLREPVQPSQIKIEVKRSGWDFGEEFADELAEFKAKRRLEREAQEDESSDDDSPPVSTDPDDLAPSSTAEASAAAESPSAAAEAPLAAAEAPSAAAEAAPAVITPAPVVDAPSII